MKSYGIIVGRFQVNDLHEGHLELLRTVRSLHNRVFVFVGVSPLLGTRRNPLDFQTRKAMIQAKFPDITVLPMPDVGDDKYWTQELDKRIREVAPLGEITLYGGRDSFAPIYEANGGEFAPVVSLAIIVDSSGEEVRSVVSNRILETSDFRAGVIYATQNQFPKGIPCVDIVPYYDGKVLLCGKIGESHLRFVGGHFNPKEDLTLEGAAMRELKEETSLITLCPKYISSARINDWRYKKEDDAIVTSVFFCETLNGNATAKDDINRVRWIDASDLENIEVMPAHSIIKLNTLAYLHEKGMMYEKA